MKFDALNMHGVYYSVKAFFFLSFLKNFRIFALFYVFCAFVGVGLKLLLD
ncbi:hypothetical protein HPSA20_1345 [Helicobacter pylori SouthAfrica20]|uniref:Uncharacterized protein n=1 Tax=Helicobacter pylori SouthAfrica20 TaxID=1352356 RepID=T1UAY6_HELPX|nr:hypothetical protein HPSA20_1345 [Helicobacter pylori SouthAfrica20]